MKEDKIDRLIRKTMGRDYYSGPPAGFTDQVLESLGIRKSDQHVTQKPLRPKRGLYLMGFIYLAIFMSVLFLPGSLGSSSLNWQLPQWKIPSLTGYLNLDENMSKILIMMIFGGWILIFADKFIRKLFVG